MMTISDIAARLGVSRAQAYGLVGLMQVKGLLSPTSKKTGSKGKPSFLYRFEDAHVNAVADLVRSLIQTDTPAAAPVTEAPAETAAPEATEQVAAAAF